MASTDPSTGAGRLPADAGTTPLDPRQPSPRQEWLGELAQATTADLRAVWDGISDKPELTVLRKPERGMVMVRAKVGGSGSPFNLGEMTVSRCVVKLAAGDDAPIMGVGYTSGHDLKHAELMAGLDALLQHPGYGPPLKAVIEGFARRRVNDDQAARAKAGATRVDFFTLVRGE